MKLNIFSLLTICLCVQISAYANAAYPLSSKPQEITFFNVLNNKVDEIRYGEPFLVMFKPGSPPAEGISWKATDFILVINGMPFPSYKGKSLIYEDPKDLVKVMFEIGPVGGDEVHLAEYLGPLRRQYNLIQVDIAARSGQILTNSNSNVKIQFYRDNGKLIVFVFSFLILIFLVILARRTNLLKEPDPSETVISPVKMRWSLSKTQLAVWTMTIAILYLMIWIISGNMPEINQTVLTLLGISFATTALSSLQPSRKLMLVPPKSNFFLDLVDDGNGPSIHRFQNVVFIGVFVCIFVGNTYVSLEFPTFDTTQLLLLGISAAGYVGMKFLKEKPEGETLN